MRIKMTDEERMTDRKTKAVLKQLAEGKLSKGACARELFAGGYSVKEISELSGAKYNHVYNVCRNEVLVHGLETETTGRSNGNTKKAKILEMLQEGKTITEVSRELQCLYNQVWQVAKANGLTKKQTIVEEVQ